MSEQTEYRLGSRLLGKIFHSSPGSIHRSGVQSDKCKIIRENICKRKEIACINPHTFFGDLPSVLKFQTMARVLLR